MNVLWIYCDELRTDALQCYGNRWTTLATPNIDALARDGVLFENHFVASPVCVPSRMSTMCGQPPERTGVYGNEAYAPGFPVPDGLTSLPEVLAENGWHTATYGKQHLPQAMQPWQAADDSGAGLGDLVKLAVDEPGGVVETPGAGHMIAGRLPDDVDYPGDRVTDNVIQAMRDTQRPFLIRASYLQPHTPVLVPEPWASMYADVEWPDGPDQPGNVSQFERRFGALNATADMPPETFRLARTQYYGLVAWIDHQVGRLLRSLDQLGLADDTVVVFTADHGAHLGEDGSYGKHTFSPVSHRVPLIVRSPGRTTPGVRRDDLAHSLDLPRTVLDLCDVPAPDAIGGRSLISDPPPPEIVSTIGYGASQSRTYPYTTFGTWDEAGRGWPRRACVRTDEYRLDMNIRLDGQHPAPRDRDVFLADVRNDPDERWNLAENPAYSEVRDDLVRRLEDRLRDSVEVPDDVVYRDLATITAQGQRTAATAEGR